MKRNNFYIKLTTAVLFLAVVVYIGVYVYNATQNTYVTAAAFSYTIEETVSSSGYIIRTESVLSDLSEATLPIAGEGEKVAAGQAVAVEYTNREALETASEIHELRLRITQLESLGGVDTAAAGYDCVSELSKAVQLGDLSRLDEIALKVETYIFAGKRLPEAELPALRERLETLERVSTGMRTVSTPVSGYFSQAVDGFESVGPDNIDLERHPDLKPSGLAGLFDDNSGYDAAGKIITGFKWYYAAVIDAEEYHAAVVDTEEASRLEPGKSLMLQFTGAYRAQTEMLIEGVGRREDDMFVVIFSCERGIHEVTRLRQLNAEIVIREVSGIRIPKEAMRLDDDGTMFIYLQTGARAERVNVEKLYEFGDSYLVRDGAETGSPLRSGATVIVKANNLFDGKVVG